MTLVDKISNLQNYLPLELKHALLVLRRTKYWKKQKIIFIHIPKAAGVSVNTALYGRFMGHATASEIRRYAPRVFQSYPSFAITRNPWARCVSAYRFTQVGSGQGDGPVAGIYNVKKYKTLQFRTFQAFVEEWLIYQDLNQLDYVFQPQLNYIADANRNIIVSHVGKLEDIGSVQNYLFGVLGREVKINHQNRTGFLRPNEGDQIFVAE